MSPLQVGRCNFLVEVDGESQHATKKPVSASTSPYASCNHVLLIIVKTTLQVHVLYGLMWGLML